MATQEDLQNRIREIPLLERLDKCLEMLGKMCSELRPPKMSIPVQWYDEDEYISTTLQDAKKIVVELEKANNDLLIEKNSLEISFPELCDCGEPFPENGKCDFCGARARYLTNYDW